MDDSDADTTGPTDRPGPAAERSQKTSIEQLGPIDDEETLCTALQSVLDMAASNGVDVTGRWFLHETDGAAWSVEVIGTDSTDAIDSSVVPNDATIVETIAMTIADHRDVSPMDLPPLYDVVDPDVLESVVSGLTPDHVTFEYAGYRVTVESDGSVHLSE